MIQRTEKPMLVRGDAAEWMIGVTKPTIDRLLKLPKHRMDAVALYLFYCYTARWQRTNQPWATVSYTAKGTGWGTGKVSAINRILAELGLIEHVAERTKRGRATKWFIRVNYIAGVWNQETQVIHAEPTDNFSILQEVVSPQLNALELIGRKEEKKMVKTPDFEDQEVQTEWETFVANRKQMGKSLTPISRERQLTKLRRWSRETQLAALRLANDMGWQGIFEPRPDKKSKPSYVPLGVRRDRRINELNHRKVFLIRQPQSKERDRELAAINRELHSL